MTNSKITLVVMDYLSCPYEGKMLIYGMLYPETNQVVLEAVTGGFNPELSEVVWKFKSIDDRPLPNGHFVIISKEHLLLGPPFSKLNRSSGNIKENSGDNVYEMTTILKFINQSERYNVFEEIVDEERIMLN